MKRSLKSASDEYIILNLIIFYLYYDIKLVEPKQIRKYDKTLNQLSLYDIQLLPEPPQHQLCIVCSM